MFLGSDILKVLLLYEMVEWHVSFGGSDIIAR